MRLDEMAWWMLKARRESPYHLQVLVLRVRDSRSQANPYQWAVDGEICRVFRSGAGNGEHTPRRFACGETVSFEIEFCIREDARDRPLGPILVRLDSLIPARFLEVFLDDDLRVPAGQLKPIDEPTASLLLSLDAPQLVELAERRERRRLKTQQLCIELDRVRRVVSQVIEEHRSDAFTPSGVSVFACGDTQVVRVMLPQGHPRDLGSIRRLVKNERRLGHVSETDTRIACTRKRVTREVRHGDEIAVFLA